MSTNNEENPLNTKYKRNFNISLVIFIIVIILNVWLYFYNWFLEKNNLELETKNLEIEKNINTLLNDPKVSLYTMLENNKQFLDKYKNNSKITEFIANLRLLSKIYKITFEWFNYSDWKISSKALVQDDSISLASKKIDNFLKNFRKWTKKDNYFNLWFVNSFDWQKNITFNVSLETK